MQPSLSFIKLGQPGNPPASGTVEVHLDTLHDGTYKRAKDFVSDFSPEDAINGTWQLFGSKNGAPMLGFIKLRNVGNPGKMVEVHWATLQHGTYKRAGDYVSDFGVGDAENGIWQLIGNDDYPPVLGFIKLQNVVSGMVEVYLDGQQGGSYTRLVQFATDFSPSDANNGVWQLFSLGLPPNICAITFIKTRNVGNPDGLVEVHTGRFLVGGNGGLGQYNRIADLISDFSQNDAPNGTWQIFLAQNEAPLLGFIKVRNVGNPGGMVEFHFDNQGLFSNFIRAGDYTSDFSQADADNGVWGAYYLMID